MIIPNYTQLVSKGWTTDSNTPICRITITNNTTGGAIDYMLESIGLKFAKGNAPNGIYEDGTLVNSTSNVYAVIVDDDYPEYVLDSVNITKSVNVANKGTASSKGTFSTPGSDYMVNMNVRTVIYSGKTKSFTVYKGYPSLYNYYDNSILVNAPGFDISSGSNHYYAIDNNQDRYAVIRGYTWRSVNNIDYIVFEARPFFNSIQVSNNSSFSNSGSGVTITRNEYFFAIDIATGTLLDGPGGNVIGRVSQFANTYNLYARVIKKGTETSPVVLSGAVGPFGSIRVTSNKSVISPSDDFTITYNSTNSITSTNENYVAFKINEYNHNYINYRSRRGYNQTITISTNPDNSSTANNTLIPLAREKNGIYASACNPIYINTRRIGASYVTDRNTGYNYYSRWHGFTPDNETLVINVKYPNPSISLNYSTISIGETITATAGNVYNKDTHNTVVPIYQYTVDNGSTWSNTANGKHQFNSLSLVGSNCKFRTKVTNNNSANYPVLDSDWVVSNSITINTYPRDMVANGFTYNFNLDSTYTTSSVDLTIEWSKFLLNLHKGRFDKYNLYLNNITDGTTSLISSGANDYNNNKTLNLTVNLATNKVYTLQLDCMCNGISTVANTATFTSKEFKYSEIPAAPELVFPSVSTQLIFKDIDNSKALQEIYKNITGYTWNHNTVVKVILRNAINASTCSAYYNDTLYTNVKNRLTDDQILNNSFINGESLNIGYLNNTIHSAILAEAKALYGLDGSFNGKGYYTNNTAFYKQSWNMYLGYEGAYNMFSTDNVVTCYKYCNRNMDQLDDLKMLSPSSITQSNINNYFATEDITIDGVHITNYFKTDRHVGDGSTDYNFNTYQQTPIVIFKVSNKTEGFQIKVYITYSGGSTDTDTFTINAGIMGRNVVRAGQRTLSSKVIGGYLYCTYRMPSRSTANQGRGVRISVIRNGVESEKTRFVSFTKLVSEDWVSKDQIIKASQYNGMVDNLCYMVNLYARFGLADENNPGSELYFVNSRYKVNVGDIVDDYFYKNVFFPSLKTIIDRLSNCNSISEIDNQVLTWNNNFNPNTNNYNIVRAVKGNDNRVNIFKSKGNYLDQVIYFLKKVL